jgi:hypothetical protein
MAILLFLVLTAVACLISGVFGIVHDQITYSLSAEYFTKFKFLQFAIAPEHLDRVGVVQVGWMASWWVGLILGMMLAPFALQLRGARDIIREGVLAFLICAAVAAAMGGAGWCFALTQDPPAVIVRYGQNMVDRTSFYRVGCIHNASYLGSILGLFVSLGYLRYRVRIHTVPQRHPRSANLPATMSRPKE